VRQQKVKEATPAVAPSPAASVIITGRATARRRELRHVRTQLALRGKMT